MPTHIADCSNNWGKICIGIGAGTNTQNSKGQNEKLALIDLWAAAVASCLIWLMFHICPGAESFSARSVDLFRPYLVRSRSTHDEGVALVLLQLPPVACCCCRCCCCCNPKTWTSTFENNGPAKAD